MKRNTRALALVAAAAIVLAACGGSEGAVEETTATTVPAEPLELATTTTTSGGTPQGEVPLDFVAELAADAADRSGQAVDDVTVKIAEAVQWNDGALGCPQPGEMYTQAIVDGYRVVIETSIGDIDYRTSATDFFIVCEN